MSHYNKNSAIKNFEKKQKKQMRIKNRFKRRSRIGRRTKEMVGIAKERIQILLGRAETEAVLNKNYSRANRYVILARKIAMRFNIRLGKYYRHKICRACNAFLGPSEVTRVRCQGRKVIIFCKNCGNIIRIPLQKKKI